MAGPKVAAKRAQKHNEKHSLRYIMIIGGIFVLFMIASAILLSVDEYDIPSPSLSVNVASTNDGMPSVSSSSSSKLDERDPRENMTLLQLSLDAASPIPTLNWRLVTKLDSKQHPVGSTGEYLAWRRFMKDLILLDKPFIITGAPLLFDNNRTKLASWRDLSSIRRRLNSTTSGTSTDSNGNGNGMLERVVAMEPGINEFFYLNLPRIETEGASERLRHWGFLTSYMERALKQRWRQSMSVDEFFTTNQSVYWSQDPSALGDVLIKDMPPHSLLSDYFTARSLPKSSSTTTNGDQQRSSNSAALLEANIWMGHNIQNTCHFDAVHNLFVQLSGPKRFILFPPSSSHIMMPFPRLHPSYRHTMLNFSGRLIDNDMLPIRQRYERIATNNMNGNDDSNVGSPIYYTTATPISIDEFISETSAQKATLQAGDMLYIPPFWYHHVTTLTRAISMSMWTNAIADDIAEEAERDVALPIDDTWSHDRILATMGCFTLNIMRQLRKANASLLASSKSGIDHHETIDIDLGDLLQQRFPYINRHHNPDVPLTPSGIERAHCLCASSDYDRVHERALHVATIFNKLPLQTLNDISIRKLQVYAYLERAWEVALSLNDDQQLLTLPHSLAKLTSCMWANGMFVGIV
jgi:hypothetical protein